MRWKKVNEAVALTETVLSATTMVVSSLQPQRTHNSCGSVTLFGNTLEDSVCDETEAQAGR